MEGGGVDYGGEGYTPLSRRPKESSGLIGFLVRAGFAKDERQANMVLLGMLAVAVAVGIGVWII